MESLRSIIYLPNRAKEGGKAQDVCFAKRDPIKCGHSQMLSSRIANMVRKIMGNNFSPKAAAISRREIAYRHIGVIGALPPADNLNSKVIQVIQRCHSDLHTKLCKSPTSDHLDHLK